MDSNKPIDPNAAADVVIDDAEAAAAETTDKPKKSGKAQPPSVLATVGAQAFFSSPEGMALLMSAAEAFFTSPVGMALVVDVVSEQLPTAELIELPETKPATAPTLNVDKAASLFGIDPADIFTCRHYPEESRYVVVTTDGRKLEMNEADHVA